MLDGNPLTELVVARLREFFDPKERWFRGLWEIGPVLGVRELLEAAEAAANHILSDSALQWMASDLWKQLKADPALSSLLDDLKPFVSPPPSFGTPRWHALFELQQEIAQDYLGRLAAWVAKKQPTNPERTARAMAAHALDSGFSQEFLTTWLRERVLETNVWSLRDLITELHRLTTIRPIEYSVLVLVNSGLPAQSAPPEWSSAPAVKDLLSKSGIRHGGLRYAGGWLLKTPGRDAFSAAAAAFDEVDRRAARLLLGRGQRMTALKTAWVFGELVPVAVERRGAVGPVRVKSIEREKRLFTPQEPNQIDAAFELLAQLDGSSALAVGAGWAAIESLLAGEAAKVDAADRLAALVTASFPRAELTSLARAHIDAEGPLATQLENLASNRERARVIEAEIRKGSPPTFAVPGHQAAVARIAKLIQEPVDQLGDVFTYVCRAFRRFYRQRNLVLHWGKTNPVALTACLRTATPLMAAGVDRIAHAWFVNGVKSVHLATVAKARIELAGRPGRLLTDMLEDIK